MRAISIGAGLGVGLAAVLSTASPSFSADVAVQCEPPKGWRAEYGTVYDLRGKRIHTAAQGIRWSEDGYSNMRPVLIWRADSPSKLLISWGHTIPNELVELIKPEVQFKEATVVYRDHEQIQAIERRCGAQSCTVYLTSLFPKIGFMTSLRTGSGGLLPNDEEGHTALYATVCKPLN